MIVELRTRTDGVIRLPHGVSFDVKRYEFSAVGGPLTAEISVAAELESLWALIPYLGAKILIYNDLGSLCWWGWLDDVAVNTGGLSVGVSLAAISNRVRVVYSYDTPDGQVSAETDWAEDSDSVELYGVRESLLTMSDATAITAEARRDEYLAENRFPRVTVEKSDDQTGARLVCLGTIKLMGRRYYQQLAGREVYNESATLENALGWKMGPKTGILFGGKAGDLVGDVGAGFTGLTEGQRFVVEGSDNNNVGFQILTPAAVEGQVVQLFANMSFDANDDVYAGHKDDDGAEDWGRFTEGQPISISGSVFNNYQVFLRSRVLPNYFLVFPKLVYNESTATNVTVTQGNSVEVTPVPVLEYDGNTITITADGIVLAQKFTPENDSDPWPLTEVWILARKVGAPSDSIKVELCSDSADFPGTVIESVTVDAVNIPYELGWVLFQFSSLNYIQYGVNYWLRITRTGASTTGNFYLVGLNDSELYDGGSMKVVGASGGYVTRTVAGQSEATIPFELWGQTSILNQVLAVLNAQDEVAGVDPFVGSTIKTRSYRDGTDKAEAVLADLLSVAYEGGSRWLIQIDRRGRASITEAPTAGDPELILSTSGQIRRRSGAPVEPGLPIVGEWMEIEGIPRLLDTYVDAGPWFIERYVYENGEPEYVPAGNDSPWTIGETAEG